ncbi:MAG: DUF3365 domain-containing protein [Balneolaceae bacterium]
MSVLTQLFTAILIVISISGCIKSKSSSEETKRVKDLSSYLEKGENLAGATQKVLASNLISAIEKDGAEYALEFCNIEAQPLTDSMAVALNAHIKRVTDQPRNPKNLANETELAYIKSSKVMLSNGEEVKPETHQVGKKVIAYYPIITNQLCMQCHGSSGDQIKNTTLEKIQSLYPEDMATGYEVGELRGIWVVEMEEME